MEIPAERLRQNQSNADWRSWFVLAAATLALLLSAVHCAAQEATNPASSFPPDATRYNRQAVAEDLSPPPSFAQQGGPPIRISPPVDVTNIGDFAGYSEPSIATNPANPSLVVIHGGFFDWNDGKQNGALFVSKDGGASWNFRQTINPPPGGCDHGPADATIYYGPNSTLFGSFLAGCGRGGGGIFTGETTDPFGGVTILPPLPPNFDASSSGDTSDPLAGIASLISPFGAGTFKWRTSGTPPVTQDTVLVAGGPDQPWVVVNSHPPNLVNRPVAGATSARANIIPPLRPILNDVYVAYDIGNTPRVSVSLGADPPNFTVDTQDGLTANGPSFFINPGHRAAVARRTVIPNGPGAQGGGTVVTGLIYSVYQTCLSCEGTELDRPLVAYMLNRTRDQGATWNLGGSSLGIEVDEGFSDQGSGRFRKYGGVNALFGGIDALAVDSNNGLVYVVYGTFRGFPNVPPADVLSVRRYSYDASGVLSAGPRVQVSLEGSPALLPSVAVAANGTVGVLYDTFDGLDLSTGLPAFSAHLAVADGNVEPLIFVDYTLLRFLSPASPTGLDDKQRVWGDFQQMVAVGNKFYGVFAGNGAAFGKIVASTDPIFFTADVSK